MIALIIAGGVLLHPFKIAKKIKNINFDIIVACDGGYNNAKKLNLVPDILIGDLDSLSDSDILCQVIKLNCEKDDTDLRASINYLLDKNISKIIILCATGGRLDHFFGNISNIEYLHDLGIPACIIDEQNEIFISDTKKVYKNTSKYVSIIPITNEIILSTHNLKYIANNLVVKRTNIISISNETALDEYTIDIVKGKAYVIKSDNDFT